MSNKENCMKVESVSKTFKLPTESTQSFENDIGKLF